MEVGYFQTYIDGVDFVFIDSPIFRHIENNIYGGNRVVSIFIILTFDFSNITCALQEESVLFLDNLTISNIVSSGQN